MASIYRARRSSILALRIAGMDPGLRIRHEDRAEDGRLWGRFPVSLLFRTQIRIVDFRALAYTMYLWRTTDYPYREIHNVTRIHLSRIPR